MNVIPIAIIAYLLNGAAVIIDKILLTEQIPDPLIYIFYLSAFSSLAVIAVPFTQPPTALGFVLTSSYTILWTLGAYFLYKGLQVGQVSRVVPVIGALVPLILLTYYGLITNSLSQKQSEAAIVLVFGLIFLILPSLKGKISNKELKYELSSGFLFAISYIILKIAYSQANFLTVLIWSRVILLPIGIIILFIPKFRKIIFSNKKNKPIALISITGLLFIIGQASGGISQLLLTYSISLGNPALVNSLQGTQYIFLFVISILLFKKFPKVFFEKITLLSLSSKLFGIIFIFIGLYILSF